MARPETYIETQNSQEMLFLFLGLSLIFFTLYDVFQSVVMPRWSGRRGRFAPFYTHWLWHFWAKWAPREVRRRESFLGVFGPLCLILILLHWVTLLILGFALCFWSVRAQLYPMPDTIFESMYLAGITFLTVGFGEIVPRGTLSRALALGAGASGMAIFALVVSLFFTLYGAFERRETLVLALDSRAGSPPSGLAILENYAQLRLLEKLPDWFERWEEWSAQVLHSHIAYPLLPYFRSSHGGESWIGALGAMLDAATLCIATEDTNDECGAKDVGAAHLFYRMGSHAILDLARWFGLTCQENPDPGISREEFSRAFQRLRECGFSTGDEEGAWKLFAQKRAVYAHDLNALTEHFAVAKVSWQSADKSDSAHELPDVAQTPRD